MNKPVFGIQISVEFSAAHHITGYDGDCARPHGHNFKVVAEATTPELSKIGIALDFKELKSMLKSITDRFDHQDLNTIAPFNDINPTAETLSRHFFEELSQKLTSTVSTKNVFLRKITVWENERSCSSYGFFES